MHFESSLKFKWCERCAITSLIKSIDFPVIYTRCRPNPIEKQPRIFDIHMRVCTIPFVSSPVATHKWINLSPINLCCVYTRLFKTPSANIIAVIWPICQTTVRVFLSLLLLLLLLAYFTRTHNRECIGNIVVNNKIKLKKKSCQIEYTTHTKLTRSHYSLCVKFTQKSEELNEKYE